MARCQRRSPRLASSRSRPPVADRGGRCRTVAARTCPDHGDTSPGSSARGGDTGAGSSPPRRRAPCRHRSGRPTGRGPCRTRPGGGTVRHPPYEQTSATGPCPSGRRTEPDIFLVASRCEPLGTSLRGVSEGWVRGEIGVSGGYWRSPPVLTGETKRAPDLGLYQVRGWRWRRESNPCTGLCRPLPKPLGHATREGSP